ncbi:MAG: ATP-binding cassette domain-containing protein, partial [Candidatus Dormibacteria bacterium]
DEPTSQLDPGGVQLLHAQCRRLVREGRTVVLAEHRELSAGERPGAVVCLEGGRIAANALLPQGASRRVPQRVSGEAAWELCEAAIGHRLPIAGPVNLRCHRGEILGLTGVNGSGKTTLLRTAAGLLQPLAGSVRRGPGRAAYLPQDPGALLHQPTALAEVAQTIRWLGLRCPAGPIIEEFALGALADRDPRDLSSGQRQRVALAAILVGGPEMVFLDEPTRGIDSDSRARLRAVLDRLAAAGAAVLVATSDWDFAQEISDRLVALERGRLHEVVST